MLAAWAAAGQTPRRGGLAAFLGAALGPRVVAPFVYTAKTKSDLAYGLLEALNSRCLAVYAESADPSANDARRELLRQAAAATCELRANQAMTFAVPEARGHDDHLNALAPVAWAAQVEALRAATSRPRPPSTHRPFGEVRPSRR